MYNSHFICTYHYYDRKLEKNINPEILKEVEQDEDIADLLYKAELLQIFNLKEFEEDKINTAVTTIYTNLPFGHPLKELTLLLSSKFLIEDEITGFMLLFSYEYMFLTHSLMSHFFKTGDFSKEKFDLLEKTIKNNH